MSDPPDLTCQALADVEAKFRRIRRGEEPIETLASIHQNALGLVHALQLSHSATHIDIIVRGQTLLGQMALYDFSRRVTEEDLRLRGR